MKSTLPIVLACVFAVSCAQDGDVSYRNVPWDSLDDQRTTPIRLTPDVRRLLDLAVRDVLTNKDLARTRAFYGPKVADTVGLGNFGSRYDWPKGYEPDIQGIRFVRLPRIYKRGEGAAPLLGLDVREIVIDGNKAAIELCVTNAGGKNTIGGCSVSYAGAKQGDGWSVKMTSLHDP